MQLQFDSRPSPLGAMLLVFDEEERLHALDFSDYETRMHQLLRLHYGNYELRAATLPAAIGRRLEDYFAGALDNLAGIEVATGGTDFQRRVWKSLRTIAPGTTMSYGQLAERIGHRGASRAVGLANGSNPVSIVVPCHRVIGANGALTGYGGGLERKQWLLEHERRYAATSSGGHSRPSVPSRTRTA